MIKDFFLEKNDISNIKVSNRIECVKWDNCKGLGWSRHDMVVVSRVWVSECEIMCVFASVNISRLSITPHSLIHFVILSVGVVVWQRLRANPRVCSAGCVSVNLSCPLRNQSISLPSLRPLCVSNAQTLSFDHYRYLYILTSIIHLCRNTNMRF